MSDRVDRGHPALRPARRDARGVVTLTLNRAAVFNALCEGMLAALQARARRARGRRERARGRHRRGRQGVLRRPRPEGDARRAVAGVLRGAVRAVHARDAGDPAPAGAGDRACPGHRHGGGLPARRDVRPRGRATSARFAVSGVNLGLFCSTPSVALSRNVPRKAGVRDARHRRIHLRRRRRARRAWSTASLAPRRSTPRSRRWSRASSPSRASPIAMGKALFYRQIETRHRGRLRRRRRRRWPAT